MKLRNPLDEFETYSVHYVLLACRTTVVAQNFASEDQNVQRESLDAIENTKRLGDPVVYRGNNTDIFLVMDTRRFAQFSVESLKYDVFINGLQKSGNQMSNLAVDLSMTVLDSVGISFANYMQWLMDVQMKTNYDGLIFMLRTIFVGHHPDGTTETVQSETIPMHLNKMEINLDFAKGAYNLEFMPNLNFDADRHRRWLTVSLATTYNTGKGNSLGGIVTAFENALNEKSLAYYNGVQNILNIDTNDKDKTLGRLVQYQITLPKEWGRMEVLGSTPGGAPETRFVPLAAPPKANGPAATKPGTGQLKDTTTAVQPSLSIPKVLDLIFKQVPDIAKLGNFQNSTDSSKGGSVTFYKHLVGITSDDNVVVVHVDVVEFIVPNVFAQPDPTAKNTSVVDKDDDYTTETVNGVTKRTPKNFLEFDYIFTGKNDSIMNFDMKIQDFQFLLASNLRIGDSALSINADTSGNTDANGKPTNKNSELAYTRKFDPIVMPLDTDEALKNFSSYTSSLTKTPQQSQDIFAQSQQYTKNLSMFYAASPITAALTIKGNPLIMHKFNMGVLLQHPQTRTGGDAASGKFGNAPKDPRQRVMYRENLENEILKANPGRLADRGDGTFVTVSKGLDSRSYAIAPVFAKINIKGPNVDFRTNDAAISEIDDFATSVLSDNYYVVFRVTNQIQGHVFTQDLELYSHNIFGRNKLTKDDHSNANAGTH